MGFPKNRRCSQIWCLEGFLESVFGVYGNSVELIDKDRIYILFFSVTVSLTLSDDLTFDTVPL